MSLSAKIIAPMILLIGLYALSTLYQAQTLRATLIQLSAVRSSLSSLPGSFREVIREAEVIYQSFQKREVIEQQQLTRLLSLRLASLSARLSESLIRLDALQVPLEVGQLKLSGQALYARYVKLESLLTQLPPSPQAQAELEERWAQWFQELEALRVRIVLLSESERRRQAYLEDESRYSALTFTFLSSILGLVFLVYISSLMKPLRSLTQGVHLFERGDYSHRIRVRGSYEFAQLSVALNKMGAAIEQRDQQLLSEQQRRLQEASLTAAGRLSAQITHELRNPLSSIGLNSELLAEELTELGLDPARNAELQNLLSDISREIERLRGITEEYLRYARIPPPELSRVDLNVLSSEVVEFYRAEAERSSVQLILDLDPIPRAALVDPNLVRSALLNLIRNACEAIEGGSENADHELRDHAVRIVLITVRTGGREARITVQDSAGGIPPEQSDRVFEPFFSTKPQGTGLGLSMVQQLTRAQGGHVTLELSTSPDETKPRVKRAHDLTGARFSLYLPLAPLA